MRKANFKKTGRLRNEIDYQLIEIYYLIMKISNGEQSRMVSGKLNELCKEVGCNCERLLVATQHNEAYEEIHKYTEMVEKWLHNLPGVNVEWSFPKRVNIELPTSIPTSEKCITRLSSWIPCRYREGLVGDVLEDCQELRKLGRSERRILVYVIWQLAIAVVMLCCTSVADILNRIWTMN